MGSLGQRAAKLPAFKVGGLKKKSAVWPWPHSNNSTQIQVRAGSNHSQSLKVGNFAALWSKALKFSALKALNLLKTVSKFQEASRLLRVDLTLSKWPQFISYRGSCQNRRDEHCNVFCSLKYIPVLNGYVFIKNFIRYVNVHLYFSIFQLPLRIISALMRDFHSQEIFIRIKSPSKDESSEKKYEILREFIILQLN